MWGELALSVQHANGYVLTMMVIGFVALIIFLERLIMLQFVFNIDFSKFIGNLKKMVAAEDLDRAINLCKNVSHTSLPKITLRALEAAETDPTKIKGTIEEESIDFLPSIEKRIGALPAFTVLIMFVGILGTIDALWGAFQSVDVLDTAKKQATLAQGIASSLNPTAMGLLMGVVILGGYYLLKGIAINLLEKVHYGIAVVHNLLVPAETAYIPAVAAVGAGHASQPESRAAAPSSEEFAPKQEASAANETFDDVSVEDIKDEEEII